MTILSVVFSNPETLTRKYTYARKCPAQLATVLLMREAETTANSPAGISGRV